MHAVFAQKFFSNADASRGDEDMQTSMLLDGSFDRSGDLGVVGHVGLDEADAGAEFLGEVVAAFSLTSAITTLAPFAASMRTVAAPRPDAPPVISALEPLIFIASPF